LRSIFVTGTDTNAGKTFVTAGIVLGLRRLNIDAVPAKPVQTGCVNGLSSDLEFALGISGLEPVPAEKQKLSPMVFRAECSPHLAAELEGRTIDLDELISGMEELARRYECVVAEGAGGILVPLGGGKTVLDLMKALNWPVLLVSRNRLGMINHTLLSIHALKHSALQLAGVVINHVDPPSLISRSNIKAVNEFGNTEILGEIPCSPGGFPDRSFTGICLRLEGILSR